MLKNYLARIPAERAAHFQRLGAEDVRSRVELKTSALAPVPKDSDKVYFEPNGEAWETFVRGEDVSTPAQEEG